MLMTIISALIGAIATTLISVFGNIISAPIDFWKPILLFIGTTIGGCALLILFAFVVTLPVNTKKPVNKPSKFYFALYNFVNEFLVVWSGARVKVKGETDLGEGPFLFVINHRSRFDTMILSVIFKKYRPLMVSKPSNFKIPIAGPAIHKSGFISMPKDDMKGSLEAVLKATDYIKGGYYSIGLCPEGTRNKNKRGLLPFKNGCLKIAMRANVPIVVITVEGTEKIAKNFPFKLTRVYFDVLKVINPDEYQGKTTNQVGDEIRSLMLNNISSYKKIED